MGKSDGLEYGECGAQDPGAEARYGWCGWYSETQPNEHLGIIIPQLVEIVNGLLHLFCATSLRI